MTSAGTDMKDIDRCVICGKNLEQKRVHVDSCRERCSNVLLERQRASAEGATYTADLNCRSRAYHHHGVRCAD